MKKIFKPFEALQSINKTSILVGWLIILGSIWGLCAMGDTHMFPTPSQVFLGVKDLFYAGLIVHLFSSLWLCTKAVFISIIISLAICYSSPIPFLKPISLFISKLRYLPLTGISFYIGIAIHD